MDMNIDKLRRSLAWERLRSRIVQVEHDTDVSAKDSEAELASRYCEILDDILGEDPTNGDAAEWCCHILEAERDAQERAKRNEEHRAERYCEILDEVIAGEETHDNAAQLRDAIVHFKSPAVCYIQTYLV